MRVDWASFKKKYNRPPKGQFPIGTRVYLGSMGQGKSLSMTHYVHELLADFPNMHIFSNMQLYGVKYKHIITDKDFKTALTHSNGKDGTVVLIDESHILMNKKNGTPLEVIAAISMQRKDRKRIIMATQRWTSIDIEARRQVQEVVECRRIGRLQYNTIYDGESVTINKTDYSFTMKKIGSELFKHNQEYYDRFDTYQRYESNDDFIAATAPAPHVAVQVTRKQIKGRK